MERRLRAGELAQADVILAQKETLARELGVARSSFYWHFKNRSDFNVAIIEYWEQKSTTAFLKNVKAIAGSPEQRLGALLELVADLAANELEWTIVFTHYPPYTKGSHDSDEMWYSDQLRRLSMRYTELGPIVEAYRRHERRAADADAGEARGARHPGADDRGQDGGEPGRDPHRWLFTDLLIAEHGLLDDLQSRWGSALLGPACEGARLREQDRGRAEGGDGGGQMETEGRRQPEPAARG